MWRITIPVVFVICFTILSYSVESKPIGEINNVFQELTTSAINSMRMLLDKRTEAPSPKCTEITGTTIEQALQNLQGVLPRKIPIITDALLEPVEPGTLLFIMEQGSSIVNITKFDVNSLVHTTDKDIEISLGLRFDPINLAGNYQLDLDSFSLHIFGDGTYNFTFKDLNLSFTTHILIVENKFKMTDFSFSAEVNSSQILMTGLLDDSTGVLTILEVISQAIPEEVVLATQQFQGLVKRYVVNFTNKTLARLFSWDDIVWLICTLAGYID